MGSCVQFHSLEHCLLCTECVILIELFTAHSQYILRSPVDSDPISANHLNPISFAKRNLSWIIIFFLWRIPNTFVSYPPRPELLYCAKACHALLQLIRTNMEASSWVFLINVKLITLTCILWVSSAQIIFKGITSLHRVLFWKSAQWLLL